MQYEDLTEEIIGCSYRVHNELGSGFLESVCEKSMCIELQGSGLEVGRQVPVEVTYKEKIVGDFIIDIFVENCIVVELTAIKELHSTHEIQLVNYLASTGNEIGLLINFGTEQVEIKRKLRTIENLNE